ncbi:hypothetical protein BE11_21155 [Sorangium cellulosum]|nr:hypothetical protein BE11_21155 [Sorangium cellulosum]
MVGISRYQRGRPNDFWNLHTEYDLRAMAEALCLYRFDEIAVLRGEEATRQGIIDGFRKYLTARSQPGDSAVFHYSGHGQQVEDDDGDEPDGLDETLVPFDYRSKDARDGAATNLRDDQIGVLLGELRDRMRGPSGRVHGNITVVLDSCFSGSATRGDGGDGRLVERGIRWEGPPPPVAPGRGGKGASGLLASGEAAAHGYVVLSASQVHQTAKEIVTPERLRMGAFTYHLTQALAQTPRNNYDAVFERVAQDLAATVPEQNPQMEGGADTDKEVFGVAVRPYVPRIVEVQGNDVVLPLGSLHGVTQGSLYALYRRDGDLHRIQDRLAEATVTGVRLTESTARLEEAYRRRVTDADLKGAQLKETRHQFEETAPLRVLLDGTQDLGPALLREAGESGVLEIAGFPAERWEVRLRRVDGGTPGAQEILVERNGGSEVGRVPGGGGAAERLAALLHGEWRRRLLATLRDPQRHDRLIEVHILPRAVKANEQGQVERPEDILPGDLVQQRTTTGNRLLLRAWQPGQAGDYFDVQLCNRGRDPLYVTVFEIDPAGKPEPIYPGPGIRGDRTNQVRPGCHALGYHYLRRVGLPEGRSVVKAIATTVPVDLTPLLRPGQARGAARADEEALVRGLPAAVGPLGRLLRDASIGRGSDSAAVDIEEWTTGEAVYDVQR